MKKLILLVMIVIVCVYNVSAQKIVDAKVNVLAGAVTIFNPSLEAAFNDKMSATIDYLGAYARNDFMNTGYPMIISMGVLGSRYYTSQKEQHQGFFMGAELALNSFRMNKNVVPLVANDHGDGYDVGYGYVLGLTAGYKYMFHRHWGVEVNFSYGFSHVQHEGYTVDGDRLFELNASAEWSPYKGGLYLIYRF